LGWRWAKSLVDVARLTKEEKSSFEAISSNTRSGRVAKLIVSKRYYVALS